MVTRFFLQLNHLLAAPHFRRHPRASTNHPASPPICPPPGLWLRAVGSALAPPSTAVVFVYVTSIENIRGEQSDAHNTDVRECVGRVGCRVQACNGRLHHRSAARRAPDQASSQLSSRQVLRLQRMDGAERHSLNVPIDGGAIDGAAAICLSRSIAAAAAPCRPLRGRWGIRGACRRGGSRCQAGWGRGTARRRGCPYRIQRGHRDCGRARHQVLLLWGAQWKQLLLLLWDNDGPSRQGNGHGRGYTVTGWSRTPSRSGSSRGSAGTALQEVPRTAGGRGAVLLRGPKVAHKSLEGAEGAGRQGNRRRGVVAVQAPKRVVRPCNASVGGSVLESAAAVLVGWGALWQGRAGDSPLFAPLLAAPPLANTRVASPMSMLLNRLLCVPAGQNRQDRGTIAAVHLQGRSRGPTRFRR